MLAASWLAEKGSPEFGAAAPTVHRRRRQGLCRDKSVRCGHTTFEAHSKAGSNQVIGPQANAPNSITRTRGYHLCLFTSLVLFCSARWLLALCAVGDWCSQPVRRLRPRLALEEDIHTEPAAETVPK